jgi:hypothetical protein
MHRALEAEVTYCEEGRKWQETSTDRALPLTECMVVPIRPRGPRPGEEVQVLGSLMESAPGLDSYLVAGPGVRPGVDQDPHYRRVAVLCRLDQRRPSVLLPRPAARSHRWCHAGLGLLRGDRPLSDPIALAPSVPHRLIVHTHRRGLGPADTHAATTASLPQLRHAPSEISEQTCSDA